MKFNKETLAGAVFVVFRVLLWLPVLAAAAFFGAALGDLLVFFAAEHLSPAAVGILAGLLTLAVVRSRPPCIRRSNGWSSSSKSITLTGLLPFSWSSPCCAWSLSF